MKMAPTQRRTLIGMALVALTLAAGFVPPGEVRAAEARQLSFYHTHTGKRLEIVYARNGKYIPSALDQINHFLFDFRIGASFLNLFEFLKSLFEFQTLVVQLSLQRLYVLDDSRFFDRVFDLTQKGLERQQQKGQERNSAIRDNDSRIG